MRKLIIALLSVTFLVTFTVTALGLTKSESLDYLIKSGYHKIVSKIMSKEIIKQLKEKEGKTIRDYYMEDYFRRMMNK